MIRAGQLFRSRDGAVTTEAARAGGGTIALHAGRLVQLQDSEVTSSIRGGGGDAGNLTLESPFVITDGSAIVSNAFGGRGGNILINDGVFLADPASLVSDSSALGIEGTVEIRAPVTSLGGTLAWSWAGGRAFPSTPAASCRAPSCWMTDWWWTRP